MKTLLFLMLLLFSLAVDGVAADGAFYGQFSAGGNLLAESENSADSGHFNLESDPGYSAALSFGYALPDASPYQGGRVELDAAWRQNGIDTLEFKEGDFSGDGDIKVWSLLLSSYGERRNQSPWTPYFGAGLGIASIEFDSVTVNGAPLADDDDLVLAYQVGVGVDYSVDSAWRVDFGYRFFGTTDPTFKDATGEEFDSEYHSHNLLVGLRYGF